MITQTDPLTIHYDAPGSFPGGRSLDETVLRPAMTHGGVGLVVDPGVRLSQKSYAMLARAARRLAREEGLSARSLTVRCMGISCDIECFHRAASAAAEDERGGVQFSPDPTSLLHLPHGKTRIKWLTSPMHSCHASWHASS